MIEKIVYDYLKVQLTESVALEVPSPMVIPFVRIEKTGSHEVDGLKFATIAIQSYADTLANAATLNEKVKAEMRDIIGLNSISKVMINSDYNFTDTTTKHYRYQAVFELTYY